MGMVREEEEVSMRRDGGREDFGRLKTVEVLPCLEKIKSNV